MRLLLLGLICASSLLATGLATRLVAALDSDPTAVTVHVFWKNAWRNSRNHDATWLFLKYRAGTGPWRPARLAAEGHSAAGTPAVEWQTTPDRVGIFLFPQREHRGDVDSNVTLRIDRASLPAEGGPPLEWHVFGIEMVYVPEGPFYLGDPDPKAVSFNSYYRSDAAGKPAGYLHIESEAPIEVGAREGALDYHVDQPMYQGDRRGPIPLAFPKGFRAFYVMKYELAQGEYAQFLNHIPEPAANFRAVHAGANYYQQRGSIRVHEGSFVAAHPSRPANWLSWTDSVAFAGWAGLRPMTDLEYTKASRGPTQPVPNDYPWGSSSKAALRRIIAPPNDDLVQDGLADELRLTDANREVFGASYYWVMDLAGSVWERVVSAAHPRGRVFRGTHGDGRITAYGSAKNEDWPKGDEAEGGFGYRGGGYYAHGQDAGELNPYSATEWRRFGAWGDAPRSVAYGFRAVRTAP